MRSPPCSSRARPSSCSSRHDEMGGADGKGGRGQVEFFVIGQAGLVGGDQAMLDHEVKGHGLAGLGRFQVFEWIVDGRGLGQPGQEGALGQIEVTHILVKVGMGC
jgi:hypothetical protein